MKRWSYAALALALLLSVGATSALAQQAGQQTQGRAGGAGRGGGPQTPRPVVVRPADQRVPAPFGPDMVRPVALADNVWMSELTILEMRDLVRSMKASRLQAFTMVNLPHALPAIFSGLKVSVTLAVVGAVVGEFVGANSGIGFVLQRSIGNFELPTMFAALVILAMISVILFWIIDLIERFTVPWHASQRHDFAATA